MLPPVTSPPDPPPETEPALTDGQLAARAAAGDRDAEDRLVRRLVPRVAAFARRHLRDPADADDLVQQVLTTTLRRLRAGELREPAAIAAFVLGTARNTLRDFVRAAARARERTTPLDPDTTAAAAVPEPDVDTDRLRDCLARLAERERTVVLLTFHDHLDAPTIGGQLGLSGGNVRVVRLRALERLRECMGIDALREAS